MFTPSPQRHPLQSFPFWFLVISGAAVAAAWKFEFFSIGGPSAESFVAVDETAAPTAKPAANDKDSATADSLAGWTVPAEDRKATRSENAKRSSMPEWARQPSDAAAEAVDPAAGVVVRASATDPEQVSLARAGFETRLKKVAQAAPSDAAPPQQPTPVPVDISAQVAEAARLQSDGEDVAAHRLLSTLYWQHPEQRSTFQLQIDSLAHRIYFEPQRHYLAEYTIRPGETLEQIGRQYQVPWEYLARMNRVDPSKVPAGQRLKVIQGPFNAVVDLGRFELTVHAYGYYVAKFPIGIGKDEATPVGTFQVTDKVTDPTYYGPDGVIEHDDPNNPLGEHWIAINDAAGTATGYGLHGTIDPNSIGKAESKGCIRLRNGDVAALYDLLTVGSEVVIRR